MAKIRTFTLLLFLLVGMAAMRVNAAASVTPGAPSVSMEFEIDGNVGKVVGTVIAPDKNS